MSLQAFLKRLKDADLELDVENILDALWLAQQSVFLRVDHGDRRAVPINDQRATLIGRLPVDPKDEATKLKGHSEETDSFQETAQSLSKVPVYAGGGNDTAERTRRVSAVRVPAAKTLSGRLALTRSLRPFRQRWLSRRDADLDEELTVEKMAELSCYLYPVFRPRLERWFEVSVVIEDEPTVAVWKDTLHEFCQMLRETGAFQDVRLWRLRFSTMPSTEGGPNEEPYLESSAGGRVSAGVLSGGTRRLIFFATHGSSSRWSDGSYVRLLKSWVGNCSVVLLHLLPRRQWKRTPLGEPNGYCHTEKPGAPASCISIERFWWKLSEEDENASVMAIPCIPIDISEMENWSKMQMGRGHRTLAFLFDRSSQIATTGQPKPQTPGDFDRLVAAFRSEAPEAFSLARYLAAGPFTLPVARLVQEARFGLADQTQLAEVLLCGLVMARFPEDGSEDTSAVSYEFHPEARKILLRSLRKADAMSIARELEKAVSRYVEQIQHRPVSFRGLVADPVGGYDLPEGIRPFAILGSALLGVAPSNVEVPSGLHAQSTKRTPIQETTNLPPTIVPPLPGNFIPRVEELNALVDALLRNQDRGNRRTIALISVQGMGGIGKTVLVQALCYDPRVKAAFPDGIIWQAVGNESTYKITDRLRAVCLALNPSCEFERSELDEYRLIMRDKKVLLIMDDAWSLGDIKDWLAVSPRSQVLFTTRNREIAAAVAAVEYEVELLSEPEARQIFAQWAGKKTEQLSDIAGEIIRECRGLALALSMVGAMLRGKPLNVWKRTSKLLQNADWASIRTEFPDYRYPNLFAAIEVSVNALQPEDRERYYALAVLLEEMSAPSLILQALWGTNEDEAAETAERFVGLSLAERQADAGSIRLHNLQLDYIRKRYPDQQALELIHRAMRLSSHEITRDPRQFAAQLVSRLLAHKRQSTIGRFIASLREGSVGWMTTAPQKFREKYHHCTWIFDLFAYGFDFLNGRFFPSADPALEDLWDSNQADIHRYDIETTIVAADGNLPDIVRRYLDLPVGDAAMEAPEFCIRLFAILSAIDRVAGDLNYLGVSLYQGHGHWPNTKTYFEHNKYLQVKASGYVIFKPRYFKQAPARAWLDRALSDGKNWNMIPRRVEELDAYFENLLRVSPPQDCKLNFRVLTSIQDFHQLNWDTLRLGIVPLIERLNVRQDDAQLLPGPLVIKKENTGPAAFGIHLEGDPSENCSDLCDRAEIALRHLAEQGCQLVLFPEMVVPDPVFTRLKRVLTELAQLDRPRPGLVLAGTFTRRVLEYSSAVPFNVAIALNNRGEELWRQRKMNAGDMMRYEQQNFGLENILNSDSCRENIAFASRKLQVVDSPATGLRMVVLIGEDATRDPVLRAVRELQPTLILAPVMTGPLEPNGSFAQSVDRAMHQTSGIFVVANSAGLARAAWGRKHGNPAFAIVGLPLLNVFENYRALTVLRELQMVPGPLPVEVITFEFPP